MSVPSKRLMVETIGDREKSCQITGTRAELLLLAQDITAAVQDLPEQITRPHHLYLTTHGWQQHTPGPEQEGVSFQAVPDLDAYLKKQAASRSRSEPWIIGGVVLIIIALIFVGLWTVISWIVF